MTTLLSILQIFACLVLIVAVLLQPSKGGAALGASSQSVFGSSGATSFLFKTTMWMAAFIMCSSLYLSRYRIQESRRSVISGATLPAPAAPAVPAPVAPSASDAKK